MAGEPMGADLGEVLVIIPTYNEAENIETVTSRLRTANPQVHVLIADDNSPDGTGEIADRLAGADEHVHVMHRKGKEGLGAAYLAGFDWGLSHDYDVLVEMDADLSHQPEQLPALLSALQHADMVKGSRYVSGGSVVNWPKSREFISRGGGAWTRLMLGIDVKDPTGGFNAWHVASPPRISPVNGVRPRYQWEIRSVVRCPRNWGGERRDGSPRPRANSMPLMTDPL